MFFTFPEDACWSAERQAVEFGVEIGEYRGLVRVPQRVFQLLPEPPTPERCFEAYYLQRSQFESIAGGEAHQHELRGARNLTTRMALRWFTRLTNAFSKKLENHGHMVALYALWYSFVRVRKTLRTSPAMAAGIETRLWSMEDVVKLIEQREDLRSGALLVD